MGFWSIRNIKKLFLFDKRKFLVSGHPRFQLLKIITIKTYLKKELLLIQISKTII